MNGVYIKTDEHNIFENLFIDKDLVSVEDLLDMLEELYYENQRLLEKIEDLEKTHESDKYDTWLDNQIEMGLK